ncbi:MAG: hypothetical protein JSR77_15165 [Planctomycetes bacterium]|nr:hypothetical protein [Planctomycetota bacterium]
MDETAPSLRSSPATEAKDRAPHSHAIAKFVNRLNAAITRSPLLKVSSKSTAKQIDLNRFSCISQRTPLMILEQLIAGKTAKLQFAGTNVAAGHSNAGSEGEALFGGASGRRPEIVLQSQLEQLRRYADLARRETGIHALWVGYPLVYVPPPEDSEASGLLAPVFLIPTAIVPSKTRQGQIDLERYDNLSPRFNTAMAESVRRCHGIELEQPLPDELQDLSMQWMDAFLTRFGEQFEPGASWPGMTSVRGVPAVSELVNPRATQIFSAGVLGIFRWQNESILADLDALRKMETLPESADGLMRGTKREEPRVSPPPESDRYFVTDADFSQQRVVWKARVRGGLVVHGPPGTGKSQTIVNIIADALAHNKTVLMVCQKDAATRVVKTRLDAAGLGGLCIEMHDPETDRPAVFREIRDQVEKFFASPQSAHEATREGLSRDIERAERDLDEFAAAMHQSHPRHGASYRHLLGLEGKIQKKFATARSITGIKQIGGAIDCNTLDSLLAEVESAGRLFFEARYLANPWKRRLDSMIMTPSIGSDIQETLQQARTLDLDHAALVKNSGVGCELPQDLHAFGASKKSVFATLASFAKLASRERSLIAGWLKSLRESDGRAVESTRERLINTTKLAEQVSKTAQDPAWREAMLRAAAIDARAARAAAGVVARYEKNFARVLWPEYRNAKQTLQRYRPDAIGVGLFTIAKAAEAYFDAEERRLSLLEAVKTLHPCEPLETDDASAANAHTQIVGKTYNAAVKIAKLLASEPWAKAIIEEVVAAPSPEVVLSTHMTRVSARQEIVEKLLPRLKELESWLLPDFVGELRARVLRGENITDHLRLLEECLPNFDALVAFDASARTGNGPAQQAIDHLVRYEAEAAASPSSVRPLHAKPTSSAEQGEWWRALVGMAVLDHWREESFAARPVLKRTMVQNQDDLALELRRKLDAKRKLEALVIKSRWTARQQDVIKNPWEVYFKQKGGKNGPAKKLREAVRLSLGQGLLALRPVWLTNPAAAAQVFPLDAGLFDVVIFDEASQCPIEQALPVVCRGKTVIVAGDEKQLPPTGFFSPDSTGTEDDDEDESPASELAVDAAQAKVITRHVTEAEDLLAAAVASLPHDYLSVHYRSENPALIEFSNRAFYNGLLESPPATVPIGVSASPISFIRVGGVYERGAGKRVNREEAKRVVTETRQLLLNDPRRPTIGIVTFNQPQRELIQDLLEEERQKDPAFAEAYDAEVNRCIDNQDVGLFVKNLENVQGDERDIMVFSTTFGPDEKQKFLRNFGPVGSQGGERRLNVAVTRAKRRIIVVSSMPTNEISTALQGTDGAGAGITPSGYLQLYLAYAEAVSSGQVAQMKRVLDRMRGTLVAAPTGGGPESILEEEIMSALIDMGYKVDSQIGVGGFRIDLAIRHPAHDRGYVLGVECDGAAYHSDRSARLRDVWRQSILQDRYGWRIYRVWSTRWWHYREQELARLKAAVEKASIALA